MSGMTRDGPTCPASVGAVVRVARSAGRRRPWTPPSASASASPDPDPDPDPDPERPAPACAGRATVATVSAAAGTAHVLWEPRVPRPVPAGWVEGEVGGEVGVRRRGAPTPRLPGREFLVAPLLGGRGGRIADVMEEEEEEEEEEEVPLRSLSALEPYEVDLARLRSAGAETGLASAPAPASAEAWKARGDALLRLGDCVAAIEAYEASLRAGGGGEARAGRDRGGGEGGEAHSGRGGLPRGGGGGGRQSRSRSRSWSWTGGHRRRDPGGGGGGRPGGDRGAGGGPALPSGGGGRRRSACRSASCSTWRGACSGSPIPPRIRPGCRRRRRPSGRATCRRAAVLGCSLALACGRHRAAIGGSDAGSDGDGGGDGGGGGNAGDAPTTEEKARLIRSAAYLALGRLRHASADARHVLARLRPGSAGAERQLARVRREARRRKRTDRRLARDVCGWVKAVTEGGAEAGTEAEGVAVEGSVRRRSRTASRFALVASPLLLAFLFACAIAAVAAWTAARDVLTAPGLTISE